MSSKLKQMPLIFHDPHKNKKRKLNDNDNSNDGDHKDKKDDDSNRKKLKIDDDNGEIIILDEINIEKEDINIDAISDTVITTETHTDMVKDDEQLLDSSKKSKVDEQVKELARLKKLKEEKDRKLRKVEEEEKKKRKKLEEEEKRKLKKLKEEEEKRIRREKIELERKLKKELKEKEKLERYQKRELEVRIRNEKKKKEEEEKIKRKQELDKKKQEKFEEKQKQIEEREKLKKLQNEKKEKRAITNFFKIRSPNDLNSLPSSSQGEIGEEEYEECKSDFDLFFLPFYIKANVEISRSNLEKSEKWDEFIKNPGLQKFEPLKVNAEEPVDYSRSSDVLQRINTGSTNEAERLFNKVPKKYLQFYENKKPPYFGTYSFTINDCKDKINLKLNPCSKIVSNNEDLEINYEFDSDFEENEDDEEGEDLDKEDEEEDDIEEEDESDNEFVETDENSISNNKNKILGPLIPVVRSLKNEIEKGDEFGNYFDGLGYEMLRHDIQFPIDPMHDYWNNGKKDDKEQITEKGKVLENETRLRTRIEYINESNKENIIDQDADKENEEKKKNLDNKAVTIPSPTKMVVKKKLITEEEDWVKLKDFIRHNKDFTINTLTEVVQKQVLNKYSKAVLKNSIKEVAQFDKRRNEWIVAIKPKEEIFQH